VRLNRYLSVSGYSSRRRGEEVIRAGRVTVNGAKVADPAYIVEPGTDRVAVDGSPLESDRARRYILLNKPAGTIVSVGDTHGRPTVFDLLGVAGKSLFPVGRLDADTTGALLLTDDGELAFRLAHPSFGVEKVYRAVVRGKVTPDEVREIGKGVVLDDGPAAPAVMRVIGEEGGASTVELTLHQGRKRQVRRMLDRIGHPVITLERISFGGVTTKGLAAGKFRELDGAEVALLKNAVRL
jgi:23S rRNA pseudouridine2605 synthase